MPLRDLDEAVLPLDAFEALRLCDAEGLDQTEAADRMQVSRGTVQRLLGQARRTVASALAEHRALRIALTNREDGHACLHPHE